MPPLNRVSILIPAYNSGFFGLALKSALEQTYADFEVIVCDDSPGKEIDSICRRAMDPRLRYVKNPTRLGFGQNFTKCFSLASGRYVKFLNDDDLLIPTCVQRMVEEFKAAGDRASLVTSRRRLIDSSGTMLPDIAATKPLARSTTYFDGMELGDRSLSPLTNFIGEPTTAMFRKSDIEPDPGGLFFWNKTDYMCLADMSLWLRLMRTGGVVYIAESISRFRLHPGQLQGSKESGFRCLTERLPLLKSAHAAGFLQAPGAYRQALGHLIDLFEEVLSNPNVNPTLRPRFEEEQQLILAEYRLHSGA